MAPSNFSFLGANYQKAKSSFESAELTIRGGYYEQSLPALRAGLEDIIKRVLPPNFITNGSRELNTKELIDVLLHQRYISEEMYNEIQLLRPKLNSGAHSKCEHIDFNEAVSIIATIHKFLLSLTNIRGETLLKATKEFDSSYYINDVSNTYEQTKDESFSGEQVKNEVNVEFNSNQYEHTPQVEVQVEHHHSSRFKKFMAAVIVFILLAVLKLLERVVIHLL